MKKKQVSLLTIVLMIGVASQAQVFIGGRIGGGYGSRNYHNRPNGRQRNMADFKPSINLSFGYGFPNLDVNQLPDYYNYYKGNSRYTGPINATIDYQYSPYASIGLLVTHGNASVNYYDYNTGEPAMKGAINNWSFLLNFMRCIPAGKVVSPYLRTAIGINSFQQDFTDGSGNKVNAPTVPSALAYQFALGAKFHITDKAGLFAEAGYGKYILNGGLTFKF